MGFSPRKRRRFTGSGTALIGFSRCDRCANQTAYVAMDQQTVRKTYKEKLRPAPAQERALEAVVWRGRTRYNAALEQRSLWWRRGHGVSATRFQPEAELQALREAFPE